MSLERALEIAELIDLCRTKIKTDCLDGFLYKEGNSYFRSLFDESSDSIEMYDDKLDTRYTVECDVSLEDNYIFFCKNANIALSYNELLPYSVLEGNWGSPEYYFQQSTIYSEEVLDKLVILWYFNNTSPNNFYMDLDILDVMKGG